MSELADFRFRAGEISSDVAGQDLAYHDILYENRGSFVKGKNALKRQKINKKLPSLIFVL